MFKNGMRPVHPGEVLSEEFLNPLSLTIDQLAAALNRPLKEVSELAQQKRDIDAATALRLAKAFGTSAEFWMNLQSMYSLRIAEMTASQAIGDVKALISPTLPFK
ncbi:HigA family addiction module antitoxin [Pseudoduganella rhizocola]|uniref:HigA family addiction module antitoxin n=1 Tax=Pseudoduganella rhizocola TaxID=3382643 RepID=UPI0038B66855